MRSSFSMDVCCFSLLIQGIIQITVIYIIGNLSESKVYLGYEMNIVIVVRLQPMCFFTVKCDCHGTDKTCLTDTSKNEVKTILFK